MATPLNGRPNAFPDTPAGWAQRWQLELSAARDVVRPWQEQASKIVDRYLDQRDGQQRKGGKRVNLFTANVQTVSAIIYGRTPQVTVTRRFADASDDVARVAGELQERLLNADLERDGDTCAEALEHALQDRLIGGLGQVRVRYEVEDDDAGVDSLGDERGDDVLPTRTGGAESSPLASAADGTTSQAMAPAVVAPGAPAQPSAADGSGVDRDGHITESACVDYVHWRDFLWSPARVWSEVRWVAFRAEMTPEQVEERWSKEVADSIPYAVANTPKRDEETAPNPWARAEVWEVWDKTTRKVYWLVEGYKEVLESKEDPYGLSNFFPCPPPMLANPTTSKVLPRPDFCLAEDLYDEVDELSARIKLLINAVRAAGVYDSSQMSVLKNLLDATAENKMFPVDAWNMFAEKGGLRGFTDWLPLDQFVASISQLAQAKESAKAELYEVTGMSDIMRGQAGKANVTATEQEIKAQYGSVRVQALQDTFTKFASRVQQLKAELIANFFAPEAIKELSNAQFTEDAKTPGLIDAAIHLLKNKQEQYRVVVKPEAVSMTDFNQLRAERTDVVGAISSFLTAAQPLMQAMPGSMPHLLRLLQWTFAGVKGGAEVEGILDEAIQQAETALQQQAMQPQQPPPNPKLEEIRLKGQLDAEREQQKAQAAANQTRLEVAADAQREQNQREQNVLETGQKAQIQAAFRPPVEHGHGELP
jgi:hypothetical protein